jgi:hypothetical protein
VVVGSFATVLISAVAALWLILGLRIDSAISPITLELAAVRGRQVVSDTQIATLSDQTQRLQVSGEASSSSDVVSRGDRQQLNDRVHELEAEAIASRSALIEIETQFCATDTVRNLMHANDMRLFSILWHKAFINSLLPTDNTFYPIVCRKDSPT